MDLIENAWILHIYAESVCIEWVRDGECLYVHPNSAHTLQAE